MCWRVFWARARIRYRVRTTAYATYGDPTRHREFSDVGSRAVRDFDKLARKIAARYAFGFDTEDLYQIARVAIFEAMGTYDAARGSLSTHLYKRAMYAVLEYAKNERGGVLRLPPDTIANPRGPTPRCVSYESGVPDGLLEPSCGCEGMGEVLRRDALTSLRESSGLTPKQDVVIHMLFVDGFTCAESAALIGCTYQNLYYLRKAALTKMRDAARAGGVVPEDLIG